VVKWNVFYDRSHHYWWRPAQFLRASSSGNVFSAAVISVSVLAGLRRAKELLVNAAFGGSFSAAGVECDLADILAVCQVLLHTRTCHLRLFNSCTSSWVVDSTYVLFATPLRSGCALNNRTIIKVCSVHLLPIHNKGPLQYGLCMDFITFSFDQ
jgi:hypothetical protein